MSDSSKIQWTDATWNPWHGCHKVSAGCKYCYMFRDKTIYGQDGNVVLKSKTKFTDPLKWKEPKLIFTCSWSDWFIEEADGWRGEAWKIIKDTPQHTYQILTKRPERIKDHLPADWGKGYPNVWLGVSVEDQKAADERIPHLCSVNAWIRFLSMEPLLGPVNIGLFGTAPHDWNRGYVPLYGLINWVIIGGESGNDNGEWLYRPCDLEWMHQIITECYRSGVPVFVKQMGTYLSKQLKLKDRHGGKFEEFPDHLKIRNYPNEYSRPEN